MAEGDRIARWAAKWEVDEISFHRSEVNQHLVRWYDRLTAGGAPRRVLVPLCGKSVDMMWLYQKGHTVIGIEGVEKAIVEFFTENKLQFTKSSTEAGPLFQTADGRLQLYQADICVMSPALIGPVEGIWDRGSYVAVNYEDRPRYAAFLRGVMGPGCQYLLWAVEYDKSLFAGPPRCLTRQDIGTEFDNCATIETLSDSDHTVETFPKIAKWNLTQMRECVYMLTPQ